jgi:hypothetical protein
MRICARASAVIVFASTWAAGCTPAPASAPATSSPPIVVLASPVPAHADDSLTESPEELASPTQEGEPDAGTTHLPYACPMHPWVGATSPDSTCPVCGMVMTPNRELPNEAP